MQKREIRDPIHGFINRTDEEQRIIDMPIFQRLRRIKQLAMAYLVYPGANHTRFEHSLGVMHIAGLMSKILDINEEDRTIVRFAALLHDIGHGPFSHVSENVLEKFVNKDSIQNTRLEEIHELLTANIIKTDPGIIRILGEHRAERIINILKGKDDPLLTSIVSGPIDTDKQDYLLRDSYFCGVKYGIFDMERLHNTLTSYEDKGFRYLGILDPDGIHSLEQYILAKYYMLTQVYRHKVRLTTDSMITRGLELGILEDKLDFLKDIYLYSDSNEYIENYRQWDDDKVIHGILKSKNSKWAKGIFEKLMNRTLFKRVFHSEINQFPESTRTILTDISKPGMSETRIKLEQKIAEKIKVEDKYVIIYSFAIKSVRSQIRDTEGTIPVMTEGIIVPFEERSTLFRSIDSAMQETYIEVYAPITYSDERDKQEKRQKFQEEIKSIIMECINKENNNGTDGT